MNEETLILPQDPEACAELIADSLQVQYGLEPDAVAALRNGLKDHLSDFWEINHLPQTSVV